MGNSGGNKLNFRVVLDLSSGRVGLEQYGSALEAKAKRVCKIVNPPIVSSKIWLATSNVLLIRQQRTNAHYLALCCLRKIFTRRRRSCANYHFARSLDLRKSLDDRLAKVDQIRSRIQDKIQPRQGGRLHDDFAWGG